jgi:type I restriction enzyme M protein
MAKKTASKTPKRTSTRELDIEGLGEHGELPAGYIRDFISGRPVRETPEEVNAVQVFARRLVEDFGYPQENIITRPQYRVRRRPSETKKSYPVDIAVFSDSSKRDEKLLMVVECKAPKIEEGRKQLEDYLTLSDAQLGVWFNGGSLDGRSHLYLRKEFPGGKLSFTELPTLPRYGQRVEDIGKYYRRDLKVTEQLKSVLRDIRNHLAGMVKGTTRDEAMAREIINILFCKVFDEINTGPDELVEFRAGIGEKPAEIKKRIFGLLKQVKERFDDVFTASDTIKLDAESLAYVVGELQTYSVTESKRDVIGDAFEVFMGPALRGEEGQFFTPRNVVHMVVDILDPEVDELLIDPACGSGGFLIAALDHVWKKVEQIGTKKKWKADKIREEQKHVATRYFRGIEKDDFLAKVTKAYMAIVGDGRGGIFCENSLASPSSWDAVMKDKIQLGKFDVVMTNPPFGSKIKVKGPEVLSQYDLGRKPKRDKSTGLYERTSKLHAKQPPQLLFIERCIQLLKPGGRLGIVIPESIMGMPTYTDIVQWLRKKVRIIGVVSMPEELFQPHTHAKTAVVFIKNEEPSPEDQIFMSVVEWCGHDSRGNATIRRLDDGKDELLDDVPKVSVAFKKLVKDFK